MNQAINGPIIYLFYPHSGLGVTQPYLHLPHKLTTSILFSIGCDVEEQENRETLSMTGHHMRSLIGLINSVKITKDPLESAKDSLKIMQSVTVLIVIQYAELSNPSKFKFLIVNGVNSVSMLVMFETGSDVIAWA